MYLEQATGRDGISHACSLGLQEHGHWPIRHDVDVYVMPEVYTSSTLQIAWVYLLMLRNH